MALEVCVKAAVGAPDALGDCPFSQRVLLTLEEKKVPYTTKLVDISNKPQWFLDISPAGKVPVINIDGKWVCDSDVITGILEEKYPEPTLTTPPEFASVGSNLFPPFVKFLLSKDEDLDNKLLLFKELTALDEHLKVHGPFIAGKEVTAIDLILIPKLNHIETTLKHYKNLDPFAGLVHVNNYIGLWSQRESFHRTGGSCKDIIIDGWKAKVNHS